jgi:hypothetical protein
MPTQPSSCLQSYADVAVSWRSPLFEYQASRQALALEKYPHTFRPAMISSLRRSRSVQRSFSNEVACTRISGRFRLSETCSKTAPKGNWCLECPELAVRSGHRTAKRTILNKSSGDPLFSIVASSLTRSLWMVVPVPLIGAAPGERPTRKRPLPPLPYGIASAGRCAGWWHAEHRQPFG